MKRFQLILLIAVAALLATEPIYHNHPLIPDGPAAAQSLCAVCASGADHATLSAPALVAPSLVTYTLESPSIDLVVCSSATPIASRAPPAN